MGPVVVGRVKPSSKANEVGVLALLTVGPGRDPTQVGKQRSHRVGGKPSDILGIGSAAVGSDEPGVEALPVTCLEPGGASGLHAIESHQPLIRVGSCTESRD